MAADARTAEHSPWDGGWWRPAQRCPSPNFGPRPGPLVDLIVLHSISLPPGEFGTGQVQALFCNQLDWDAHPYFEQIRGMEVSAHFLVTRDGEVLQFVATDQRAWHAGASQWRGRNNCNDDSIGIELEGLEGGCFAEAQYPRLVQLCQALAARHPIAHIAGHEHIAPGRKQDPGPGFDWPRLKTALAWPTRCFP